MIALVGTGDTDAVAVRFAVLGPVEVRSDGQLVPLSGKPLVLLTTLLVRANTVVSPDALAQVLWQDDAEAPVRAKGTVQTYVMRLRRALGADVIRTTAAGYQVDADAESLDLLQFRELAEQGEAAVAAGDDESAVELFDAALQLWRGPALLDVESDALHSEDVSPMVEQRLRVWESWVDAQLRRGEVPIAELQRLTAEHPLRERFWEQLLLALSRAGRPADALAAYRHVAGLLADELGLDPSPSLRQLHQAILTGEISAGAPRLVPHQLSPAIDGFTGRAEELAELAKLHASADRASTLVVAIEGTGGVGKTALALRFARDVVDEFPDGQVQVNLQGHGPGEPVPPLGALGTLLQSVGVAGEQVPAGLDARAALWRTRTAGRRLLVLLDNARDSEQVRPLLPGPGALVLVTSRAQLRGLAARDGMTRIPLARLGERDALALLARTVGAQRVHADPGASRRFVERCARLPLAIRILGQHANQQPDRSLADILDELAADGLASFDLDDGDDTNLRVIFARSYAALDPDAARLFRLLGLHPGVTFDEPAAAAMAGRADVHRLLDRLVRAYLLEQPRPGRYELHDLLREFAVEQTSSDDEAAVVRLLDWYVRATLHLSQKLRPGWADESTAPAPAQQLPEPASYVDALKWYADHHNTLVAAAVRAHALGLHRHVCDLALALRPYFRDYPIRDDVPVRDSWKITHEVTNETVFTGLPPDGWLRTYDLALDSARALSDRRREGRVLSGLCAAHRRFGDVHAAIDYGRDALTIAQELQLPYDECIALNNVGVAYDRLGDYEQSYEFARRALDAADRTGDQWLRVVTSNNLSDCCLELERYDEALQQARRAWDLLGDGARIPLHDKAFILLNFAAAEAGLGAYPSALSTYRAGLAMCHDAGARLTEAEIHEKMARIHVETGDAASARAEYEQALTMLEELHHRDAERIRALLRR